MNNISISAPIRKDLWGSIDGKDVWLFCLGNKAGTRLYVSNFGAAAQALFFKDRNGNYDDILLGYDTLSAYQKDEVYLGTVVGRYANRIAGGEVWIDGEKYKLSTREGGYHQHGGENGFNKKVFNYSVNDDENSITFSYTSPDMEEGFPGELQLQVKYTLDDGDNWHIEYRCQTNKTTLVNLTQHAYFNLAGHLNGSVLDHELLIMAENYLPVNSLQVPTGELAKVGSSPFDFLHAKKIGDHIFDDHEQLNLSKGYDHSYVLKKEASEILNKVVIVEEQVSGRKMEVFTSEPAVHFYTGNFLNNAIVGKQGAIYKERSGFCLETQHYPDAPNKPNFPSTVLKAGEQFCSKTIYAFSLMDE
ncbi:MAG: aldose epimerase family protein [Ferruginibacter sp.]